MTRMHLAGDINIGRSTACGEFEVNSGRTIFNHHVTCENCLNAIRSKHWDDALSAQFEANATEFPMRRLEREFWERAAIAAIQTPESMHDLADQLTAEWRKRFDPGFAVSEEAVQQACANPAVQQQSPDVSAIRAAERERCASVCEIMASMYGDFGARNAAMEIAERIRNGQ